MSDVHGRIDISPAYRASAPVGLVSELRECSGCPQCNEEYARVLQMNPTEYAAWLTARNNAGVPPPVGLVATVRQKVPTPEQRVAQFFDKPRPLSPAAQPLAALRPASSRVPAPIGLVATIQQKKGTPR